MKEVIRKGTLIGKWKVAKVYKVGAFTFADVDCTPCTHESQRTGVPLGQLTSGKTVGCKLCYYDERRAACKKALAELFAQKKVVAASIRKRFQEAKAKAA